MAAGDRFPHQKRATTSFCTDRPATTVVPDVTAAQYDPVEMDHLMADRDRPDVTAAREHASSRATYCYG